MFNQAQMEADQKQLEMELSNGGGDAGGDGGDADGDGKPTSPVEVHKHSVCIQTRTLGGDVRSRCYVVPPSTAACTLYPAAVARHAAHGIANVDRALTNNVYQT